jgi:hypothetical protein
MACDPTFSFGLWEADISQPELGRGRWAHAKESIASRHRYFPEYEDVW